ncbi:hypothetical protein [Empedobacter brevis]|uniref:hypothetical protein n=1 Tax=Empedobacter brevis TaxID=247 RepID=UPI00289BDD6B|nr:hypothetical protein [Empedobacter brevis]
MIVLNDIELIGYMRPLNVLKNGFFHVSYLYLSDNYLEYNEISTLKLLNENKDIVIFELSNDFYDFYNKAYLSNNMLGITDISSIYYSKINKIPLVTCCEVVKDYALKEGVLVYSPSEALEQINIDSNQINYLNHVLKLAQ